MAENSKNVFLLGVLILIIVFSSCVPRKRLVYVQSDKGALPSEMIYTGRKTDNVIKPRDELYIRISSSDENPTNFGMGNQAVYNPTLSSYTVSENGTIKLPYIGVIKVANLTLEEASDQIEKALGQFLFIPTVFIRYVNNKVTVIGEVTQPGVYFFDRKNINILEAIGYARDISEFGNRRKVLLIREEGVTRSKNYIDLTDDNLFRSEFYIVQPDDIIYVEPLGRKKWGIGTVPYNLLFSAVSTFLVIYSFVNTNK